MVSISKFFYHYRLLSHIKTCIHIKKALITILMWTIYIYCLHWGLWEVLIIHMLCITNSTLAVCVNKSPNSHCMFLCCLMAAVASRSLFFVLCVFFWKQVCTASTWLKAWFCAHRIHVDTNDWLFQTQPWPNWIRQNTLSHVSLLSPLLD